MRLQITKFKLKPFNVFFCACAYTFYIFFNLTTHKQLKRNTTLNK